MFSLRKSTSKQLRTSTATVSPNPRGTYKTAWHRHKFRKLNRRDWSFFFLNRAKDLGQIQIEFLYTDSEHFTVSSLEYNSCVCPFLLMTITLHPSTGRRSIKFTIMKESQSPERPILMTHYIMWERSDVLKLWVRSRLELWPQLIGAALLIG